MSARVRLFSVLVLGYVSSQELFEEHRHMARSTTLNKIPKQFEIRNADASKEFEKYANRIHQLAKQHNESIIYKVKVDVIKHRPKYNAKKLKKKGKSKKYNVPLKKNSMKMSNFEAYVKKMAEENNHRQKNKVIAYHSTPTTEKQMTTKQYRTKYKPIISKLNNFTKVVKPVRNRIITLKN